MEALYKLNEVKLVKIFVYSAFKIIVRFKNEMSDL